MEQKARMSPPPIDGDYNNRGDDQARNNDRRYEIFPVPTSD